MVTFDFFSTQFQIKIEAIGLTKVDEIFSHFQSILNAFYFCQVDMQTAVKDFKTAVNTMESFACALVNSRVASVLS